MSHSCLDPLSVSPANVWGYAQNKPTLIVKDLVQYGVPASTAYAILMARGVFKWLAVRRDLIKLKDVWRDDISRLQADIVTAKAQGRSADVARYRGELHALERCRRELRALCHSERWRAPDFDGAAWRWMLGQSAQIKDVPHWLRQQLRRRRAA